VVKIEQLLKKLEKANIDLAELGLDAVLTAKGPLLIGDARFSVPFSEARYRSLIDRLDMLVLELTANGQIVYSNEVTSRITGISTQELLATNCLELIKPCNSKISIANLHTGFLENVELVDYQTGLVTADGSTKVISWHTFDIFNNDHKLERIVYFGIDITQEQQAEEKLSISAVAFNAAQSMFVTDDQGFFQDVNSAFTATTGYTLAELVGKTPSILKSGRQDEVFYQLMWLEIKSQGYWLGELWNKRKNGEIYLEQVSIVQVMDVEHKVTHYVATFTNVSQIKAYEAGLIEAKEKAERYSTLKSQFIASMSHEIRTPMTAIIGFSELALNQDMSEKVQAYVEKINIASNSLLGILQDILDFTKLEAGRVVIDALPFNILDLLGTIHTLFSGAAQQKGLEFTIVRDSVIPFEWIGDKLRLQQVLINLIGNAIKFTAQGSVKLEISLQAMTSSHMQLLFCVTDTGIGISLEDQSKLFIEFSQVDGSISRQYGGTGLGLAISKELVELMGGEISVLSQTNEGSTFSFALQFDFNKTSIGHNADLTNQGHKVRKSLDSNKFKGHRVLVVDDNEGTQALIQEYLHDLGIVTEVAEHGLAALTLLEQHEFDVVLMDIHMPIMNGLEATQRIHQQEKNATLPIIALSAGVTEAERNNCIARGMVGFISKPIDVEQLCTVLELWLKPRI
jgi:PAS domain S-box-containing protein